ncbi:MAG: ABC transporter substrate-binding protein [Planctomycetaceae bacterium]
MMTTHNGYRSSFWVGLSCCIVAGCLSSSSDSASKTTGESSNNKSKDSSAKQTVGHDQAASEWSKYPDIPRVDVMLEVDGIEIPRSDVKTTESSGGGKVPADVGNPGTSGKPVRGDWLTIRLSSEPKTMNAVVETSAVQSYISEYVNEALARQDPETLKFEPLVAKKWIAEDAVKLAPDYDGQKLRVAQAGGEPQKQLEITYSKSEEDNPAELKLSVSGVNGNPIANVWVGLFPLGDGMPGAPRTGYHYWSDADGVVPVSAVVPGRYTVRVGREVFGQAVEGDDGSLTVTPLSPDNPLSDTLKSSGKHELVLAQGEWVDVQRSTVYTYLLRDDVTWSDGAPFTSKDLVFAYAAINNAFVDGESLRVYYSDLISCDALGKHAVRMKYRQQYFKSFEFTAGLAFYAPPWHLFASYFAEDGLELTLERLTPEQEAAQKKISAYGQKFGKFYNTDERYNLKPLGTGPYVISKWERSDRLELDRNKNYWNADRQPYLDRLIFKFIPDNVTALQALASGEIDFFYRMDSEQYFEDLNTPKVKGWFDDNFVKAAWFVPSFSYVGWNALKPMFQDRRVRIALRLLFNVDEFVKEKLHGAAVVVSGSQYYFGPAYDHGVAPLGYQPEVARDLLTEAGWVDTDGDGILDKDSQKFEFTMLFPPGNPVVADQLALMQKAFRDAGIVMSLRSYEWASFIDKVKERDFEAVRLGWSQSLESDPFQIWHGSQAGADRRGSNHVSFSDPKADELIEMLRLTLDDDKRRVINSAFHRILDREQPYLFLYTAKDFGAYQKRFRGVKWYRIRPGFDLTEWYVPQDQQKH